MNQAVHALAFACRHDFGRQVHVHACEFRAVRRAAFAVQRGYEVDHAIGALDKARELNRIEHVRFDHVDGQQGEMAGVVAPPGGDPHVFARFDEGVDEMAADKTGTADDRNGFVSHFRLPGGSRGNGWRGAPPLETRRRRHGAYGAI
jgi:hypothetical protein